MGRVCLSKKLMGISPRFVAIWALATMLLWIAPSAHAATFSVDSTADSPDAAQAMEYSDLVLEPTPTFNEAANLCFWRPLSAATATGITRKHSVT